MSVKKKRVILVEDNLADFELIDFDGLRNQIGADIAVVEKGASFKGSAQRPNRFPFLPW